VVLGLASMTINLMVAEMILRTRFRHQLVGLMKKYLGVTGKHIQAAAMIIGYYGALTAYIIGEGNVLASLFPQVGWSPLVWSIVFFAIGTSVLFVGLKLIEKLEFWLVLLIIAIVITISIVSINYISVENYYYVDLSRIFLPYGVILFAFGGTGAIFSMREILRKREEWLRPAIVTGAAIPMVLYSFFALVVLGVTGLATTDIATIGLGQAVGPFMTWLGNLFAIVAMATSFFTIGIALVQMYRYDYRMPAVPSWALTASIPLLVFLFVSQDFIGVIGTAGSLTFGMAGIITVLAFWRSKKIGDQEPAFKLPVLHGVGWFLMVIFFTGILYTFVEMLAG
jgi:amino acid permease